MSSFSACFEKRQIGHSAMILNVRYAQCLQWNMEKNHEQSEAYTNANANSRLEYSET